jgi:hypothetical protein
MLQKEIIIKFYEYFFQKLTGDLKYQFKYGTRDEKTLNNFLLFLEKKGNLNSYGEEFWFNYMSFAFLYWKDKYTFLGKNKVLFIWIIGEKMWSLWEKRSKDYLYFCENNFIKIFNIKKSDLIKNKSIYKIKFKEGKFDFGQEIKQYQKIDFCLLYSDLFEEDNENCINCKNQNKCKEILDGKMLCTKL